MQGIMMLMIATIISQVMLLTCPEKAKQRWNFVNMLLCLAVIIAEGFINPSPRLWVLVIWGLNAIASALALHLSNYYLPKTRLQEWQAKAQEGIDEHERNVQNGKDKRDS